MKTKSIDEIHDMDRESLIEYIGDLEVQVMRLEVIASRLDEIVKLSQAAANICRMTGDRII